MTSCTLVGSFAYDVVRKEGRDEVAYRVLTLSHRELAKAAAAIELKAWVGLGVEPLIPGACWPGGWGAVKDDMASVR